MTIKRCTQRFILAIMILSLFASCVEKEYDMDNLNKTIELKVPPVPLGSFDTIFVDFLPTLPNNLVLGADFVVSQTIRGLFDEKSVSKFFYEGSYDAVISTKADIMVLPPTSGLQLEVISYIINNDNSINELVKIPPQKLIHGKNQTFEIRIKAEYMKYMKNARDLRFVFGFTLKNINFDRSDYILFKQAVLSTGGIQVDL